MTVAIIDAYDDPNAESDFATYRSTYNLPACITGNGCFHKVNQSGQPNPLPATSTGSAGEVSLDLDMVSAVCPDCHILLVEATSPTIGNLGAAVNTAVSLGAKFVSNSYGGPSTASPLAVTAPAAHHSAPPVSATTARPGSAHPRARQPSRCAPRPVPRSHPPPIPPHSASR